MIVVTTPYLAGNRISDTKGQVFGLVVRSRGLSGNPVSSIGFERAHNPLLALVDADVFADALVEEMPPAPAEQERILAANRAGRVGAAV